MSARNIFVTVAVLSVVATVSNRAGAYCVGGPNSRTEMPVRIHADLHNEMMHSDGRTWTRHELEQAVRVAIARINDSAGANIPFLYLDDETQPSNCEWRDPVCTDEDEGPNIGENCGIADTIHLVPVNCGTVWWYGGNGGDVIQFQSSNSPLGPIRYGHFGPSTVFEYDLVHEIGHVLGLRHPSECAGYSTVCPAGSPPCAAMDFRMDSNRAGEIYLPDDRQGLRALYGPRPAPAERLFESSDLSVGAVEWSVGPVDAQSYFAASSRGATTVSNLTLTGYRRDGAVGSPVVYSWDWPTLGLTNQGHPWDHFANGTLGAAQSSVYRFVTSSTFRLTPDARRWRRRLTTSYRRVDGVGGWTTQQADPSGGAIEDSVAPGVSIAYDETQAAVLYAYRSSTGKVLLQAGLTGAPFQTGIDAKGPPSIACVPSAGLNCIVVSTEPGGPITTSSSPRLRWFRTSWNPATGWTVSPLKTEAWIIHDGNPQVAGYWNGVAYEYAITYRWPRMRQTDVLALHMNAVSGIGFSYAGQLATETGVTTYAAPGSTRDLEVFTFAQ